MAKKIIKTKEEKPRGKSKIIHDEVNTGNLFLTPDNNSSEIPLKIGNSENFSSDTYDTDTSEINKKELKVDLGKTTTTIDLSDNLFIEVHKSNLLQYFASGVIFPSKYSSQKAFSDPQSINENGLLVSNGIISKGKDHILIQIESSAIDLSLLSSGEHFSLYDGIIPISRVVKIIVSDIDTKKRTIDDSLIRDAGRIPESLIDVGISSNLPKVSYKEINIVPKEWDLNLKQFDKILGLIAGTRNFNVLTFNQTGKYKSIADHSLFAIQAMNKNFAKEVVDSGHISDYYKWLFTNSCPNDRPLLSWIFNRVYEDANFTDSDTAEFESICFSSNSFLGEEKQVKNIFFALRKSLERKKVLPDILSLQSKNSLALYVFAYLRNFGTYQNPELPRLELINSKINKFSEYAFATLNFFFGYKQLRNSEDRISLNDSKINQIIKSPFKPIIKFELTTEFDYRIIDTVFNFAFGLDLKNNNYSKYRHISAEKDIAGITLDSYEYFSAIIYGKHYLKFSKTNVVEQVIPLLNKLPNEIPIFSEFGLLCHRSGLKRHLIGLDELIGNPKAILKFVYYSKNELIDAVNESKIDMEELNHRIMLSQKHREL